MGVIVNQILQRNPLDRLVLWVAGRFGEKSKEVERFLKFAIVGAIGWVIDFGVLNLLQSTILVPVEPNQTVKVVLASGTSFTLAVLSNFTWNRYWTYPDSRSRSVRRQLVQFFIISVMALGFRAVFIGSTFAFFGQLGSGALAAAGVISPDVGAATVNQIGTNIAQGIAVVLMLFWNFFANRYWTYSDVD